MKKIFHIFLAFLMLAGLLSGCGNKASQDTDVSPSDSGAAQDTSYTETPADDGVAGDLFEYLFSESGIRMGMSAEDYPASADAVIGEPFGLFSEDDPCRSLTVHDGVAAGLANLYFWDEDGLSYVNLFECSADVDTLSEICGDPSVYQWSESSVTAYWMLDDVLAIYDQQEYTTLELYTEALAKKYRATELARAKTGLLLFDSGLEDIYWYQDILTGKYGLYDALEDSKLTGACYDDYGAFDPEGMAPVQQDDYWGYINASGETIIGHYFENAESFVGECAIVGSSGNWGAIDRAGNYVVQPEYYEVQIDPDNHYILVKNSAKNWGAYDRFGNMLIKASTNIKDQDYESIVVLNGLLYAKTSDRWCHVFDENGEQLLSEAAAVSLPQNGFHIVMMEDWVDLGALGGYTDYYYTFADECLNVIGSKRYNELTDFSASGYAIGYYFGSDYEDCWDVIDTQGNVVHTLCRFSDYPTTYEYANSYMAYGHDRLSYGVVDLQTGELTRYEEVEPVDGTEYMIVTADSGLKGLYERDELAFDCVYDEISFSDGVFHLTRGAESKTYEPA
ncbi:MAG: WG repeat-containing protein [Acutalibacteraceae bacterium]|jgi:predicted small lipoprotein YifL